jgi:hypothetical protein
MMKKLKKFIPKYVRNKTVLRAMDCLKNIKIHKISEQTINEHAKNNASKLNINKSRYFSESNYIENQPKWREIQFGKGRSNMAWSGCEIIATYNALNALGANPTPNTMVSLISNFETDGAMLSGYFGTSPRAIYNYFKDNNYNVLISDTTDIDKINNIGKNYDTVIVTIYNDKNDITQQVHTVNITKSENGLYTPHNICKINNNGKHMPSEGFNMLNKAIEAISANPKVISIIGITNK